MKMLCIYHGNCADGFGAAWVVRKALGEVDFHAGVYQQPPPDVTGREVIMVDFSYKRQVLVEMASKALEIGIIDHHKTAAEDLINLPQHVFAVFDMEHSGAILTWDHFFPGKEPPQLLRHIEDRDLWRFALAGTREIQANVFSHPYDFALWDELMARPVEDLIAEGRAIERKHFKDIDELLGVVTRRMNIGGYNVPIANLPYIHVSDAAHKLCANGEPFAGCYWDTPRGRVFGLRSTDTGVDVSEIAKLYGGGGHRNASGFTVDYDTAAGFEIPVPAHEKL
jgi:oligoribonuclease NrnB/cAMP/cGMP phosphodiesterase (DHH superfamily)